MLTTLILLFGFYFFSAPVDATESGHDSLIYLEQGGSKLTVESGGAIDIRTGGQLQVNGSAVDNTELGYINGVVAGTVTADKAVVVDSNKDASALRNLTVTNIDSGASGTAGTVDIFPTTAAKGKIAISAADSAGDTTTTVTNASQAGARTYTIPDAGASASFVMTEGAQTVNGTKTIPAIVTTNIDSGASGTAGTVDIFPTTASKGKVALTAADSAGDTTTTIVNASQSGARTYTIPDFGASANFTLSGASSYQVDGVTFSPYLCVDSTVTAALLDSAGSVTVVTGVSGDQYKIAEVFLTGGGTNFAAGGDRLIDLTDGTTVWTTIANADIESVPAATLRWGDVKVPFLTGTSNTKSASAANIRWQYSGGTTDHSGTGSIVFRVCVVKTD